MAVVIEMPKLSDTMESGVVLSWKKKEGDTVASGDILAEVETDKASMDLESFDEGVLRKIVVPEGKKVNVGAPIAILADDADEDIEAVLAKASGGGDGSAAAPKEAPKAETAKPKSAAAPPAKEPAKAAAPAAPAPAARAAQSVQSQTMAAPAAAPSTGGRVLASPLAHRMAREMGIDLARVPGSGPEGRVIKRDIERAQREGPPAAARGAAAPGASAAKASAAPPALGELAWGPATAAAAPTAMQGEYRDEPVSSMRSVIARRLTESKNTIPHYYVSMDIAMDAAWTMRESLNAVSGQKISINDMVVKAAAAALQRHPMVNASWQGETMRVYRQVDIAVAVALEDGLITPVVRNVPAKGLAQISAEIRALAEKARARKLQPAEYTGSTFTISNLGMLGVSEFTAIINPPEAAILAVGGIRDEVVWKDGAASPERRMKVTMSSDHRIVDGAMAARFLQTLKALLETPASLAL